MESLLPTCCGSMQPASDPTAKRKVPPLVGPSAAAASLTSALLLPPHAVKVSNAAPVTSARVVLRVFMEGLLSVPEREHQRGRARWNVEGKRSAKRHVLAVSERRGLQNHQAPKE